MAIVLRDRKDDIPYPWLWTLFVTFIVACGLTHTAHVWSAATGFDYFGDARCDWIFSAQIASVGTAIAFAFILPQDPSCFLHQGSNVRSWKSRSRIPLPALLEEDGAIIYPSAVAHRRQFN
jgi:hypothetical protein